MKTKNLYNIKYQSHENLLAAPKEVPEKDEQVTCSRFEFIGRIHKLFEKFEDFDWTGVVFSGGLLASLIQKKYNKEHNKKSDIDLFIFDRQNFYRVYEYFKSKFRKMYSFGYADSSIVTIITYEFDRPIQLIGLFDINDIKKYRSPIELISDFDISSCQIAFDGENCITTGDFLEFCETRIAKITGKSIQGYRIIKTIEKGFGIYKPDHNVRIDNFLCLSYDTLFAREKKPVELDQKNVYDIDNLDINKLRNDPDVKKKLNKFYVPPSDIGDGTIFKKIVAIYPKAIIINGNNIKEKSNIIFYKSKDITNLQNKKKILDPCTIKSNYITSDNEVEEEEIIEVKLKKVMEEKDEDEYEDEDENEREKRISIEKYWQHRHRNI